MAITFAIIFTGCNTTSRFLHRRNIPSSVCNHRWGMDMSFTQTSDLYVPKQMTNAAEFYGLKYNIPLTVFVSDGNSIKQENAFQMGRMDFGVYVRSCVVSILKNPRKYVEQSVDSVTKVRGGLKPSTLSFGCGKDEYRNQLSDLFLMGRNSLNTNDTVGFTYYGKNLGTPSDSVLSHLKLLSRPSTTRYFQLLKDSTKNANEIIRKQIIDAFTSHGFFTDFSHWQAYNNYKHINIDDLHNHFKNISKILDTISVYRGSFNQIAEYYYARESVNNIKTYRVKKKIIVEVYYSKKDEIDYNLINVPVSVKLNTGEYKKLINNYSSVKGGGLRKLENGDLVLDIDLDYSKNFISDTLEITENFEYLDFKVPQIEIINNILSSDQEVKVTVFEKFSVRHDTDIIPVHRSLFFSKEHHLPVTKKREYDYYIGIINKTNNSGLIKWE